MKNELFSEKSMELLLKIKKIEKRKRNKENDMLFDALNERAGFLVINMNNIITAKTEKAAVIALREAYMKIASTRYFVRLLFDSDAINESEAEELLAACDELQTELKPSVEWFSGMYDEMPDSDCFEELNEIWEKSFGDHNADNSSWFEDSYEDDGSKEEELPF